MKIDDIDKTVDAINRALAPLMKKLGLAAEQIFEWAIRQNYVQAATLSLIPIIAIICVVFFFRRLPKVIRAAEEYSNQARRPKDSLGIYRDYTDTSEGIYNILILIVVVVIGLMAIIASAVALQEIVSRFVNPEWMALQDILRALKN